MEKNKKYYKNNKKNNYYKKNNHETKKVTYDSLMHAKTITETEVENTDFNKLLIMKYIAVSVILFVIIIGSILLFRVM